MGELWNGISTIISDGSQIKSERFTYTIEKLINNGASITYKAKRNDGKKIFLKHFKSPNSSNPEWREFIDFQKSVLRKLLTLPPSIIEINYEFFEFGGKYKYHFQAKAFEEGMDLEKFIEENELSFIDKLKLCAIIAGILKTIHQHGIIHSDLKPAQIFMVKDKSVPLGYRPKIIDFDHCIIPSLHLYNPAGTDIWKSPEHIKEEKIDYKSDIFTLGLIIIFILSNGGTPFDVDNYEIDVIKGKFLSLNEIFGNKLPSYFADTVDKMLNPDKNKRPELEEVQNVILKFQNEIEKGTSSTPRYIRLESNGRSVIISENKIITRDFIKNMFGNYKKIYTKQFELIKDNTGKWFIKGFNVPSEGKDKQGNIYKFYPTLYNGKDVTNSYIPIEDGGKISVGKEEFVIRMVF